VNKRFKFLIKQIVCVFFMFIIKKIRKNKLFLNREFQFTFCFLIRRNDITFLNVIIIGTSILVCYTYIYSLLSLFVEQLTKVI